MIRIAICDDERFQAELLQGYVKEWGQVRRKPAGTALFSSGNAFLFAWDLFWAAARLWRPRRVFVRYLRPWPP